MATRKAPPLPPIAPPTISAEDAVRLLTQQITRANAILASGRVTTSELDSWDILTKNLLEKAFGQFSPNVGAVADIGKYGAFPMTPDETWWNSHYVEVLQSKVSRLRDLVEVLETDIQLSTMEDVAPLPQARAITGRRVFLVHGHDNGLLHEVARYLQKLGLAPIVLREQPNSGRTIIEKFVDYSDVAYAVVLLTPDDRGAQKDVPCEQQRPRARQNVIFELGYFIGRLSRGRVTALYTGDVEIPSDYSGVAFVQLDDRGAWRLELARELKAANIQVDMNLAL